MNPVPTNTSVYQDHFNIILQVTSFPQVSYPNPVCTQYTFRHIALNKPLQGTTLPASSHILSTKSIPISTHFAKNLQSFTWKWQTTSHPNNWKRLDQIGARTHTHITHTHTQSHTHTHTHTARPIGIFFKILMNSRKESKTYTRWQNRGRRGGVRVDIISKSQWIFFRRKKKK